MSKAVINRTHCQKVKCVIFTSKLIKVYMTIIIQPCVFVIRIENEMRYEKLSGAQTVK